MTTSTKKETKPSTFRFKKLKYSELKALLEKDDNLIPIYYLRGIKIPILGTANCNK